MGDSRIDVLKRLAAKVRSGPDCALLNLEGFTDEEAAYAMWALDNWDEHCRLKRIGQDVAKGNQR